MFSIFRKRHAAPETVIHAAMGVRRMSLEDRMAFRRKLADQVVRESLQELQVPADDYNLRLMPIDPRHHRYIVMLDVTSRFAPSLRGQACTETEVESRLRCNASEHHGLSIEGIYWRARVPQQPAFEPRRSPRTSGSPALAQSGL